MRLIEVKLQCGFAATDNCNEVAVEGDESMFTHTISFNGGKAREIDLCKTHHEYLIEGIMFPLMRDGRPVEQRPRIKKAAVDTSSKQDSTDVSADLVCRVPDCEMIRPAKSGVGLAQHVTRTHGYKSLAAYREAYSIT